jgi:uncharacterized protein (TIGR03435 family)
VTRLAILIGVLLKVPFCHAQTPATQPHFDVASIKMADPSAPRPGRLGAIAPIVNPGRVTMRNARITDLIKAAYGIEEYQISGGPAWKDSARFDVDAKAANANRAQLLIMLRTLLAERFQLASHLQKKEFAVYSLVVAKGGPKFRALTPEESQCWPGCAATPGKVNHLRQKDLASLAAYLTRLGGDRPVLDRTGLTGSFALDLDTNKIMEQAGEGGGPPTNAKIFDATVENLQDELGLKLTPGKAMLDILVIDRAEMPAGN